MWPHESKGAQSEVSIFSIGVVAHHSRHERAEKMADYVGAEVIAVDSDGKLGAGANHEACYRWLAETTTAPWCVLLEDDAVPVKNFRTQLDAVLRAAPNTGLLSLYLGRSRPPHYQPSIARVIARDEHFLLCDELLHHVAVAIRTPLIGAMLTHLRANRKYARGRLPIDEAIGQWARAASMPVAYCHPSIVNHDPRLPTVIAKHVSQHPADTGERPAIELRQAWAFGTRQDWQTTTAAIPKPA